MMKRVKTGVCLVLLVGSACDNGGDVPLLTGTWDLEAIEDVSGNVILVPDAGWQYWVRLHEDGVAEAGNACNDCGGRYELSAARSITVDVGCTEMACGDPVPFLGYGGALNSATRWELDGDVLRVTFSAEPAHLEPYYDVTPGTDLILVHRARGQHAGT
jgi:hypothetical protein